MEAAKDMSNSSNDHDKAANISWAQKAFRTLQPFLFGIFLLAIWQTAVSVFEVSRIILPPPMDVLREFISGITKSPFDKSGYLYNAGVTLYEAAAGLFFGVIAGVFVGAIIAYLRTVERILYPYIIILQSMPKIAIAPLIVIWFGYGIAPKIIITSIIVFFPVFVNTLVGFHSVDKERMELAISLGATGPQIIMKIQLPSALPFIFAGLNMGVVLSMLGAIVGEFMGAQAGLGSLIITYESQMQVTSIYAILIILAFLGLLLNRTARSLERRFCFWAQRTRDVEGLDPSAH